MVICYDLEFPELTRAVALAGAQLLAVPTNWPLVPRPDGERPPEAIVAMAAARVNRMAVACADRLGTERGLEWTGGATIIGVDGWVAAETRETGPAARRPGPRAGARQAADRACRRLRRPAPRALRRAVGLDELSAANVYPAG